MNSPLVVKTTDGGNRISGARFRLARVDDHLQISELQARYGLEVETYETWMHLWAGNPAFKNLPDWPIGWVLESEEGRIVGYIGNLLRLYEMGNQRFVVSSSRGLVVEVDYRNYSLPLLSHFFNQRQVDLFLDTTVSAGALKAHEIFRALRVPAGAWDRAFFWVTNYGGFSASLLARKEVPWISGLRTPVSLSLFLRDILQGQSVKTRRNGIEPAYCTRFDERFDDFWQKLRKACPHRLMANRSQEMLAWHFKCPLAENRAWVSTISNAQGLAAYAIFLRQDNPVFSLTRMRLVDFQALDGNTELLGPIICHALARCRQEGIHMLEAIGFAPDKQRVISSLAPHQRSLSSWRYFYKTGTHQLAETLKNANVWDPSCFDGDASL